MLRPSMRLYFVFLVIFVIAGLLIGNRILAAVEAVIVIALMIYSLISGKRRQQELLRYIESVTLNLDTQTKDCLLNMPLPMVIFNIQDGRVIWSNESFFAITKDREHLFEVSLSDMVPSLNTKWLTEGKEMSPDYVFLSGRYYRVYGNILRIVDSGSGSLSYLGVLYWIDITEYVHLQNEYALSRPVVSIIMLDNYDDLFKNLNDTAKSSLLAAIDMRISDWSSRANGYISKIDRDRYVFIFEERYLQSFIDEKFSLIDDMHQVRNPSGVNATVSIGIGKDASSLDESFQNAKLSIEMALSRGGDQAVIKNKQSFEFYGGHTSGLERRTKVKSRIMASAMGALMERASKIIIMGHKYADLDCIGPAAGLCCLARKYGKPVKIVYNRSTSLVEAVVEKLRVLSEYKEVFITEEDAILFADSKTLLIVVDTNRPEQVESESLLASCNQVAVVDHHRRAATYIANADLNFHEPYASSSSELVAELLEYLAEPSDLLKVEAEALMAGIVLDTENFTVRTGSKTFDAAAFLKRAGADVMEVKKLFRVDMASAKAKYAIIQQAELYRDGILISAPEGRQDRIIAAKAADEMLDIIGIQASFVVYEDTDSINISARSLGNINVQVILEKLGGGGNTSMAGAQITGKSMGDVLRELYSAIDSCSKVIKSSE
jgi:c-di-AMP phosphodiesterase-like protein